MKRLLLAIVAGALAAAVQAQTPAPKGATGTDKPGGTSMISPTPGPASAPALPSGTTPSVTVDNVEKAKAAKAAKKAAKKARKAAKTTTPKSGQTTTTPPPPTTSPPSK